MTVYFALYGLCAVFTLAMYLRCKDEKKRNRILCWAFFAVIFLLLALRHESMGVDLGNGRDNGYLRSFEKLSKLPWRSVLHNSFLNYEVGFRIYCKLIGVLSGADHQVFLAVTALVSLLPIAVVYDKLSRSPAFSYVIYLGLPVFLLQFSGLRQDIAIGLCALSLLCVEEKKPVRFLLLVAVATLFHKSAFVFLIAYPLYHIRLNHKLKIVSLLLLPLIFVLRTPLFLFFSVLFKPNAVPDDNGALTLFLVLCAVYFFCFVFSDESEEQSGLLNIFFVACACQAFGGVYTGALRVGYYFMLVLPLLLPKVIAGMSAPQDRKVCTYLISLAFVAFSLYSIANSTWAEANPYYWFWEQI